MSDDKEPLFTQHENELLDKHLSQIAEHFDTVQLFVTKHTTASSVTASRVIGNGNWFARYGQVREWLKSSEAQMAMTEDDEDDKP